jgi:hypothetical protein
MAKLIRGCTGKAASHLQTEAQNGEMSWIFLLGPLIYVESICYKYKFPGIVRQLADGPIRVGEQFFLEVRMI